MSRPSLSRQNWTSWLLPGYVFFLPSFQKLSIFFLVLITVVWLLQGKWRESFSYIRKNWIFLLFVWYFFMHVVGLLNSSNLAYAFSDLETKLGFLLFPLILPVFYTNKDVRLVKRSFVAGCLFAALYCMTRSLFVFNHSHDSLVFFYAEYSYFLHVSYFSLYITLALLFLFEELVLGYRKLKTSGKIAYWLVVCFLLLNVLILSARTATATMYFSLTIFLIATSLYPDFKTKKTVLLLLGLGTTILVHFGILRIYDRYSQVQSELKTEFSRTPLSEPVKPEQENSASARLHLWPIALQVIQEHPWGVGTGDIKDVLSEYYSRNNFTYGVSKNYNPHNQFLHTGVILGYGGILTLAAFLLLPLYIAWKKRNWLYLLFILATLLNGMTESILERQAGVLFFSFFHVFLFLAMVVPSGKPQEPAG